MISKDGKTFSAYVRSKLHSGYITLLIIKRQVIQTMAQQLHLAISPQFYTITHKTYS